MGCGFSLRGRTKPLATAVATLAIGMSVLLGSASPAAAGSTRSPCNIASPAGERIVPLTDQGTSRPFVLFVPEGYKRKRPIPLVVLLHPSGSNGDAQLQVGDFAAAANSRRYAIAAPNGAVRESETSFYWNVPGVPLVGGRPVPAGTPDDERYLLRVIKRTKRTLCVDKRRVYFAGYSGGARMASQMACDHPAAMAAIAPVAGLRAGVPSQTSGGAWAPDATTCKPRQPVSVLAFHGTADSTNPYPGNDDPRWGYGVEQALAAWARKDRCRRGPATRAIAPTADLLTYGSCRDEATVGLYRLEGGGHIWPGDPVTAGDAPIDASALILDFFADHRLPKPNRK